MKRTISLCIIVSVLLAGVTFSVFAQSYDPDDSTDSTASDYLELSPASPGSVTVNPDQWVGMFRDGGAGTSGTPVPLDDGEDADTTYYLDGVPGDGHTQGTSGGTTGTTTSNDGYLRYSVLYQSGTSFDITVQASSAPSSNIAIGVLSINASNGKGDTGSIVASGVGPIFSPIQLTGSEQTIINGIGGSTNAGGDDFVANDGTDDYFEAYTGTTAASDGANIEYTVTSFADSVEDVHVTYTISAP